MRDERKKEGKKRRVENRGKKRNDPSGAFAVKFTGGGWNLFFRDRIPWNGARQHWRTVVSSRN